MILAIRTETGLDENVLERLVQEFYSVARQDPLLGPVFDKVKDWEAHIQKISTFWSSVALMTGRYHGQPMSAHLPLALEREHFERWLVLFEKTALLICTPTAVTLLMARANRIAQSLELGIAVNKGVIPAVKLTQADVRQPSPSQNNTKETSAYNAG
ncbi:MAG: group III truncated hemoglobin [Formivibrio sp.]|nr:group III truncated hemoglobin [Formivibrio sp.]